MAQSDRYYIGRCMDGYADDFRYLVRRYQSVLMAYLVGRLGNRSLAEEAAQETLVRAYFGLGQLKKPESFYSWLLGIAQRVAKEQLRSSSRYRPIDECLDQRAAEPLVEEDYSLEQAIAQLPEKYRELILLRFYGDMSCLEVSEQLGMPLGTVTKKLSRAYAKLRESIEMQK